LLLDFYFFKALSVILSKLPIKQEPRYQWKFDRETFTQLMSHWKREVYWLHSQNWKICVLHFSPSFFVIFPPPISITPRYIHCAMFSRMSTNLLSFACAPWYCWPPYNQKHFTYYFSSSYSINLMTETQTEFLER
jgi:hypothetical protein